MTKFLSPAHLGRGAIAIAASTLVFSFLATSGLYGPEQGVTGANTASPFDFVAGLLVYGSMVLPLFAVGLFVYLVTLGLVARRSAVRRRTTVLVSPIVFVPLWIVAPPPLRIDSWYVHYSLLTALLVALATRLPRQSSAAGAPRRRRQRRRPGQPCPVEPDL